MNDMTSIVAIISVLGWLVLAIGGYRSHRVSGRKTLLMAAAWLGIFIVLFVIVSALS